MNKLYALICCMAIATTSLTAQTALRLDVIDASTDQVVKELTNGTIFTLDEAQNINFQGVTDGDIGSLRGQFFVRLDGNQIIARSEGVAPFAAFGDISGDYTLWSAFTTLPAVGNYEIDFLLVSANGNTEPAAGEKITRSFSVQSTASLKEASKASLSTYYKNGLLVVNNPRTEAGLVSIYSLGGKLVNRFEFAKNLNEMPVNLNKGIYIVNIKTQSEKFTGKISVL